MKPITKAGYNLLHEGSLALAQVEANGIRMDTDYLQRAIEHTGKRILKLQVDMKADSVYKTWKKIYGS